MLWVSAAYEQTYVSLRKRADPLIGAPIPRLADPLIQPYSDDDDDDDDA